MNYVLLLTCFRFQEKSAMDEWMDDLIKISVTNENEFAAQDIDGGRDPYAKLEHHLE